jgi:hypothetical protein
LSRFDTFYRLASLVASRISRHLLPLGFAGRFAHLDPQPLALLVDLEGSEQDPHRRGADSDLERVAAVLLARLGQGLVVEELPELQVGVARSGDDVGFEVEDLLQIPQGDLQDVSDSRGQRLEEPDVGDRSREGDVPHPLAADLGLDHLDAALLTHDPAVLHALVLAANALVVFDGAEDLGAEQAVAFGLERSVVDRLRLLDFAERPTANLLRRRNGDPERGERERILGLLEQIVEIAQKPSPCR